MMGIFCPIVFLLIPLPVLIAKTKKKGCLRPQKASNSLCCFSQPLLKSLVRDYVTLTCFPPLRHGIIFRSFCYHIPQETYQVLLSLALNISLTEDGVGYDAVIEFTKLFRDDHLTRKCPVSYD